MIIKNDGKRIVETNYPQTEWYKNGIIAASVNAGCVRLLMPDAFLPAVAWDMQTAKEIIITKGSYQGQPGYEVLFDDHTDNPYVLQLDARQFVSLGISDSENGREDLTVGIYGMYGGKFHCSTKPRPSSASAQNCRVSNDGGSKSPVTFFSYSISSALLPSFSSS